MRKLSAALLVLLIAAGVWWYASPIWTLHAMQDAAKSHDADRLSGYVDYPALREDLRGDLGSYVTREAAKAPGHVGGKVGAAIAMALLGPAIDAAVSPRGIAAMFAAQDRQDGTLRENPAAVSTGDHPIIERDGIDSFRVHRQDASRGALVFHRYGLGWKLVGVDLPKR